eukprot:5981619-Amphidinium_carterae.1
MCHALSMGLHGLLEVAMLRASGMGLGVKEGKLEEPDMHSPSAGFEQKYNSNSKESRSDLQPYALECVVAESLCAPELSTMLIVRTYATN